MLDLDTFEKARVVGLSQTKTACADFDRESQVGIRPAIFAISRAVGHFELSLTLRENARAEWTLSNNVGSPTVESHKSQA